MDYLARSSFMLQQGKAVADILWYYGEDNNITGLYSHSFPDIPKGYNFDFASPEVLLEEIFVKDGKLRTKTGMEYSVLCLDPNAAVMSDAIRKKIEEFKKQGITVCGHVGQEIASSLLACDVTPDWTWSGTDSLNFVHRRLPDAEIYWINSPVDSYRSAEISLRVSGLKPYLWHPVSGEMKEVAYTLKDGRTLLSLTFEPQDAFFIVFKGKAEVDNLTLAPLNLKKESVIEGRWDVTFEDKFGQKKEFIFENLHSWSEDPDLWVKHFSGTAVYRKTFDIVPSSGKVILDLGHVKNVADIYINGTYVRTLWKAPFHADITEFVKEGSNQLEIRVTNLWVNRLIGDSSSEDSPIRSYTSKKFYTPEDTLLPSGLLGDVKILIGE
jgi:hypothetical protein